MGISDILNLSADRSKKYPDRDKDQLLIHFRSLNLVDESKFGLSEDPVVIYRAKGIQEQVKVLPFNFDNNSKNQLPFSDKIQYYDRKVTNLKNNSIVFESSRNVDVTAIVAFDYGTIEEFVFNLKNPTDLNIGFDQFFGSVFLDLPSNVINELQIGMGEIING